MQSTTPNRSVGLTMIAVLSLAQSALGVFRALHWFGLGSDLTVKESARLPIVGIAVFVGGTFIITLSLLYIVFACGVFLQGARALWLGVPLAIVNLLLVFHVITQRGSLNQTLLWGITPVTIVTYSAARALLALMPIKPKEKII